MSVWTSTFLSHLSRMTSSSGQNNHRKNGLAVKYSAISNDQNTSSALSHQNNPNICFDLDVEDTVTCFCRFV